VSETTDRYAAPSEAEIARLVGEHPLAWVVTVTAEEWRSTALPLRPGAADADGRITAFLGHFARSNPHADLVRRERRALLLFMGVNGYVSPSWMADRSQAPTWNYASAQFLCELELLEQPAARDVVLADLAGAMETGRSGAWDPREMGNRYATLANRILAFRATVIERRVRFKLGQDERDDVYGDITAALDRESRQEFRDWMERANPKRPRR
jgi:transcriptional regulator